HRDPACETAIDTKGSRLRRRLTGVGIFAGEDEFARPGFRKGAVAGESAAEDGAVAVRVDGGLVAQRHGEAGGERGVHGGEGSAGKVDRGGAGWGFLDAVGAAHPKGAARFEVERANGVGPSHGELRAGPEGDDASIPDREGARAASGGRTGVV